MISAIIPIHNLGKKGDYCLKRCLDSILAQTYNDYEVLLMENGSTDDTVEVAKEYCNKDDRFKLHILDTTGVSNARNQGLDIAKGEYIAFIDGDDFITENYFNVASSLLDNNKEATFIQFQLSHYYLHSEKIIPRMTYDNTEYVKLNQNYYSQTVVGCWQKVIRKDVIDNNHIRFNTSISFGEDYLFMSEMFFNSKYAYYSQDAIYYYVQNRNSQTTRKNVLGNAYSNFLLLEELYKLYINFGVYDNYTYILNGGFISSFIGGDFATTPLRKLNYTNVCSIINKYKDRILATNPMNTSKSWQKVWFKRFQKAVSVGGGNRRFSIY